MNASAFPSAIPLLQDYLHHAAIALPDKIALVCLNQRVTYRELNERSNALAHTLIAGGVGRGDRVLIFADNTIETVVSFWAVLKAGGIVSLIDPLTKSAKLRYLIDDCRPVALITDAHIYHVWKDMVSSPHLRQTIVSGAIADERLAGFPGAQRFDAAIASGNRHAPPARRCISVDLAAIIYTSGSTGEAKGVMLTHLNMLTAATSIASYLEMREDDVVLGVLPLSFDYGLYQMIMAFRVGARLVLERSFTFPAQVLNQIIAEGVTGLPGVPTIFAVMAEMETIKTFDFSKIRFVTNTAAALSTKHITFLRELFPSARIYSMYGLTECKRCTYLPPQDLARKSESVGIAIPNTELWLVDELDQRVGPGVVGELVIRGATVMKGYWEKPEATAQKLKPGPVPGEQVLYTGDLCRLDEEGYLYFVARKDDVFKSRGQKVAPKEVENVLHNIRGVKEAAVIGVPDEVFGLAVKAFVVLERQAALSATDIRRECQSQLASFLVPKFVEVVPELPRTATGKIKKTNLI